LHGSSISQKIIIAKIIKEGKLAGFIKTWFPLDTVMKRGFLLFFLWRMKRLFPSHFRQKIIIFPELIIKSPRCDSIVQITHLFPQLTVIGLHGDSTANALRVAEEDHSIERESAITQHPPVVANIVLGHLSNQTRAIPKVALVSIYLHFLLFIPFEKALTININDHAAE